MEQSDNDADIVRSLLFLMDSNIETKNNDSKDDEVNLNLSNSSQDDLSHGYFSHEYARREVDLNVTEIDRESERRSDSLQCSFPIKRQDGICTRDDLNSSDVPDPTYAHSDVPLCSLSVAVCSLEKDKPTISHYRAEQGDCTTACS